MKVKKPHFKKLSVRLSCLTSALILAGNPGVFAKSSNANQSPAVPSSVMQYGHIDYDDTQSENVQSNETADTDSAARQDVQDVNVEGVTVYSHRFGADEINRLARSGVKISSASRSKYMDLEEGNVLLNPATDITVATPQGKVSIAAHASVFIMVSGHDVAIYDFSQSKPKEVSVAVSALIDGHKIVMEPGRLLVMTRKDTADFSKLDINCTAVPYTHTQPLDLHTDKVKAYVADFSVTSAFTTIAPLKRLTLSQYKHDTLTVERLVKSAVILGDVCPVQTAMAR